MPFYRKRPEKTGPQGNYPLFPAEQAAFTLIELSIVLVIIGLIIGGVLVGQDLVTAAATRAQISQIEKFNQAVNTFYGKYGYLPGDMPDPYASQFGFVARGQYVGEGDGNGVLDGVYQDATNSSGPEFQGMGETAVFWRDLSTARLIEGGFSLANETTGSPSLTPTSSPNLSAYFPPAKIGNGNYIYVADRLRYLGGGVKVTTNTNWYSLAAMQNINGHCPACVTSIPAMTVAQAYNIDKKIDDGLPQSGNVVAEYVSSDSLIQFLWAGAGAIYMGGSDNYDTPYTTATPGSATSCFDNGNGSGPQQYSMEIGNGSNPNCAIAFKMQGGGR